MSKKKPWKVGKESAMLQAWLTKMHPTDIRFKRVRLGPMPLKEPAAQFKVLQRWADAILIHDGMVEIIEAKLRPNLGVIGQLEGYKKLFLQTPEFTQYHKYPVKMKILAMEFVTDVVEFASDRGIEYEVFTKEQVNQVRNDLAQVII